MGGPAMIEGGGLGVYEPGEVGPIDVQDANGVVDLRVADERRGGARGQALPLLLPRADRAARATGPAAAARADPRAAQARLRRAHRRVETLFDEGSVLELRRGFGAGIVTALAKVDGRPLGVVANEPTHLGGAIDADGADKAARFLALCDAFELPVLFLCDTPGFMVGPAAEQHRDGAPFRAPVPGRLQSFRADRHDRAAQGLRTGRAGDGRRWLQGAAVHGRAGRPRSSAAMGLEGAVRLGMRRELEAIEDDAGARAGLPGDGRGRLRARSRHEHGGLR